MDALLRQHRPAPPLPPGFQRAVWRRLERVPAPTASILPTAWLDQALAWLFQPRLALAGLAALVVLGAGLGLSDGLGAARTAERDRYLAAVSPLIPHP